MSIGNDPTGKQPIIDDIAVIDSNVDYLLYDLAHENLLFPEDTNETITFTAGGTNNIFGAWAEVVDNNSVKLSSKSTAIPMHISTVQEESSSLKDKVYIYEISYGASKTVVARGRLLSGTNKLTSTGQARMRNLEIPAGELIYYRLKCETASATITLSLRYHLYA